MNAIEEPATPGKTAVSIALTGVYAVVQFCSAVVNTIDLPTFYRGQPYLTPAVAPVISFLAHLAENSLQSFELFLWLLSFILLASLFLRGSVFSRVGILVLVVIELADALLFFQLIRALNIADGASLGFRDVKTSSLHFLFNTFPAILIASLLAFGYGSLMKRRHP